MRTDIDLMTQVIASFTTAAPTSDGNAAARTVQRPPAGAVVETSAAEPPRPGLDLATLLEQRGSSLAYADEPISMRPLWRAIGAALERDARDWDIAAAAMPLEIYVFALRPCDVTPGIYRIDLAGCSRVGDLPPEDHWDDLGVQREFARAGAIVSAAGDLDAADTWQGGHGYRLLMGRTAAVIYEVHLEAVGLGHVGTVFAGFIPSAVRSSLLSDGTTRQQMFATTVAAPMTWERR